MYVTVSNPRCGCQSVPRGSPGWYSTSPIWSMWTNGSNAALFTPANARTTGNPSPSWPRGPVVSERTGRSVSVGPATVTRGKANVSAVIAGISGLLVVEIPDITGPESVYSTRPD